MKIIVDAYGGDNAPLSVLNGVQMAVAEYGVEIILVGKESELKTLAQRENINLKNVTFIEATETMPVEVEPSLITSQYTESSLAIAIKSLRDGMGDAVVSAGSTGAVVVGGIRWIKRMEGVKRPALGVVMPTTEGCYILVDGGANSVARPEMLAQFGVMGSVYMNVIMGIDSPRVGMINIGSEANKGLELQIKASELLRKSSLNFIGNIEPNYIPVGGCDVAVSDGFTGNIVLKLSEGMGKMMKIELKNIFYSGIFSKMAALLMKKEIYKMSNRLNPSEYGGVPLLGLTKAVIKAHGSSDAMAIKNAIRQARNVVEQDIIPQIEHALIKLNEATQE